MARKNSKLTNEEIFCENSLAARCSVRQHIIRDNLLEYKCAFCGNTGEWLGKEIAL